MSLQVPLGKCIGTNADMTYSVSACMFQAHLKAIQNISETLPSDPNQQRCLEFMTSLDLVTSDALKVLEKKKSERRRITRSRLVECLASV